ncbi:MAG TPA: DJ-1/PfpI family protein [Candidatus Saccharimonadales bacterium]|nr:DJ-1/PfpI family protein [Candidatus Saccharimonadales bacterium]
MANEKYAFVYVQDTWSDWEAGHIMAELNTGRFFKTKGKRIPVKTVGITKDPITTAGGAIIVPDATVNEVTPETSAVLILVGGDTWQDATQQPIIEKAKELLEVNASVAAICGATTALGNAGVFDNRPHTSNTLEYLKMVAPNYKGDAYYKEDKVVADGNLITANSAGGLLFARYILDRLAVFSPEALEAWYNYFNTGEAKYFFALMKALPQR